MEISVSIRLNRTTGFKMGVDLVIPDQGITAIFGPSGSGKSTLLRLIAGLEKGQAADAIHIVSGDTVWQDGVQFVPAHQRSVGMVFQQQHLFPHLSVSANLGYAIKRSRGPGNVSIADVVDWLDLRTLLPKSASQLSGGESQRVAIARVMLNCPDWILMDEPLAAIDKSARTRILHYLELIHHELNIPIIYVSHSLEEVTHLADRLILLDRGQVTGEGDIFDLMSQPQSALLGEDSGGALIRCEVADHDIDFHLTQLQLDDHQLQVAMRAEAPGTLLRMLVPARDVSLSMEKPEGSSILNIIPVSVESITEQPGISASVMLRLNTGRQHLLARITRKSLQQLNIKAGDRVFAQIKSVSLLTQYAGQQG